LYPKEKLNLITFIYYYMKKLLIPFIFAVGVLFQSCTGPRGPEGPAGLNADIARTFELEDVNFNAGNDWQIRSEFRNANLELFDSDVVLAYILWDVADGNTPIWRLMPQAIDMPRGVVYNFDFTPVDFTVFIDGPDNLLPGLSSTVTQNQTFRVVVIPSDWTQRKSGPSVDFNDYEAVKKHFNLDDSKIQKLTVN
jgi:hypothetical protein